MAGLALVTLGCIGPLADIGDPPPPASTVVCCAGYTLVQMAALVGAQPVESGHDELTLPVQGFRVRIEAVAVSRGVRAEATKAAGLGVDEPLPVAVDDRSELLAVLVSITAADPLEDPSGGHWRAGMFVGVVGPPGFRQETTLYFSEKKKPKGTVTRILMTVVPIGSTVVMCTRDEVAGPPWLNVRTGRVTPAPADARGCGQRESLRSPGPSRS